MGTHAELLDRFFAPDRFNSQRSTVGVDLKWHPQLEVLHQGTKWHRAGLAATRDAHAAIGAAERVIYPEGIGTTEIRTWQTADPNVAFIEYRVAGPMWNGRNMANGGLAVFEFKDDQVRRVRNFTNTAYLHAVESGWEDLVSYDTALDVPAFHTIGLDIQLSKPYHPARYAKFEDEPAWKFEKPWTNEQRVRLTYDPSAFDMNGPPRDGAPYYTPTDDMYYEWQGTKWAMAGRNYVKDLPARRTTDTDDSDFHVHTWLRFTHLATWATPEQEWVFMEWMSKSEMWTGKPFLNHGMTAMHFTPEGQIRSHREYNNIAYNEAMEEDWRDKVSADLFAKRACASTWDMRSEDWVPTPIFDTEGSA